MVLRSVLDETFLRIVKEWIEDQDEVFVVIRYAYMAGARDYHFVNSFEQFQEVLAKLPPMADVIVFREQQLPYRGIADQQLLNAIMQAIPDGTWWFLLCLDANCRYNTEGDQTHKALRQTFDELGEVVVAVGLDPPYHEDDNPKMQSALVPLPDGSIKAGAY